MADRSHSKALYRDFWVMELKALRPVGAWEELALSICYRWNCSPSSDTDATGKAFLHSILALFPAFHCTPSIMESTSVDWNKHLIACCVSVGGVHNDSDGDGGCSFILYSIYIQGSLNLGWRGQLNLVDMH